MKTYYLEVYSDADDGLAVKFTKLEVAGEKAEDFVYEGSDCWSVAAAYLTVYEHATGTDDLPRWLEEVDEGLVVVWLQHELHKLGVHVVINFEFE